jgi:CBS domain-containing protein
MPKVSKLLEKKASNEITGLPPTATVLEAARKMDSRSVGAMLVIDNGRLVGIFTERDLMRRVVVAERDPASVTLEEVMTSPVACANPDTHVDEVRDVIRRQRIRHLPVVDDGKVIGMVSIGDLNRAQHETHEQTIQYLEQFISRA